MENEEENSCGAEHGQSVTEEGEKDISASFFPTEDETVKHPCLKSDANLQLSSVPENSFLSEKEAGSEGENVPSLDNGLAGLEDNMSSIGDAMAGVGDGLSVMGECVSDIGENISGMVDRMMAEMTPGVMDLSHITAGSGTRPVDRLDQESSTATDIEKREIIDVSERESNEGVVSLKQQRKCSDSDSQQNLASPRSGRPPSGPFVVGNQMDIMSEMYASKVADVTSTSSGTVFMDNPLSSTSGTDNSPFLGRSLLDAFKWHSTEVASYQDRCNLKRLMECPTPRQQKVRTDLTLADKVRLIGVSETTGRSQRSLAAEFHISVGSVNNILKRKREYKEAFENSEMATPSTSKTSRCYRSPKVSAFNELQMLIMRWLEIAKVKVKPLTWPMVLEKAREFAAQLKVVNLNASRAWLETLRQSMNIPLQVALVGVRSENDSNLLGMWRKMLPFLVQGYQPENIFSVTETTLYYKCLPDCCYVGGPVCQNSNIHIDILEHRLTVLLCCNMLGERLKPLVVSRYSCPPSMRGVPVGDLPVVWCHQPNAVMTTDIFSGWLRNLETSMSQQKRHIAVFMEMTPSHLSSALLKHVSLKFYLDDSVHLLQPLNHGIVRDFKAYFRRRLLQTTLAHCGSAAVGDSMASSGDQAMRAVTELDVVFWIQDAWRTISLETIRTCFHKAAFPQTSHSSPPCLGQSGIEPLPSDFLHLVQEAGRTFHFTPMAADLYAEFDSQLPCHSSGMEDWERTLLAEASGGQLKMVKKEPGEFDGESGTTCSLEWSGSGQVEDCGLQGVEPAQALRSLSTLKRFSANNIGLLTTVFELESMLLDSIGPPGQS